MTYRHIVLGVLMCFVGSVQPKAWQPAPRRDAFTVLVHKTGWILLGGIQSDTSEFVTHVEFQIVGRKVHEDEQGQPEIPRVGDRIRVTTPHRIVILGYWSTGEKDRLVSPTTLERLRDVDQTDLEIRAGAVVEVTDIKVKKVKDIQLTKSDNPMHMALVWARVEWP